MVFCGLQRWHSELVAGKGQVEGVCPSAVRQALVTFLRNLSLVSRQVFPRVGRVPPF